MGGNDLSEGEPQTALRVSGLAVPFLLMLQLGGCVWIGGGDWLLAPIICSVPSYGGWVKYFSYVYATGLVVIPLIMLVSLIHARLRLTSVILGFVLCIGIGTQIALLDAQLLHCDGP